MDMPLKARLLTRLLEPVRSTTSWAERLSGWPLPVRAAPAASAEDSDKLMSRVFFSPQRAETVPGL
jgi:hypothetical protein